jgi:hypothetical protein
MARNTRLIAAAKLFSLAFMPRLLIAQAANASHVRGAPIAQPARQHHAPQALIAQQVQAHRKLAMRDIIAPEAKITRILSTLVIIPKEAGDINNLAPQEAIVLKVV